MPNPEHVVKAEVAARDRAASPVVEVERVDVEERVAGAVVTAEVASVLPSSIPQ
jgi:hypothetical protein